MTVIILPRGPRHHQMTPTSVDLAKARSKRLWQIMKSAVLPQTRRMTASLVARSRNSGPAISVSAEATHRHGADMYDPSEYDCATIQLCVVTVSAILDANSLLDISHSSPSGEWCMKGTPRAMQTRSDMPRHADPP